MTDKGIIVSQEVHRQVKLRSVEQSRKLGEVAEEALMLGLVVMGYWPENEPPEKLMVKLQKLSGCSPANKRDLFPSLVVKLGGEWK